MNDILKKDKKTGRAQKDIQPEMVEKLTDTAFEKYDIYFQMASFDVKRKMLGSIFPGKLIYQEGK